MRILIPNYPVPPSSNHLYFTRKKERGRAKTAKYREYVLTVHNWKMRNNTLVQQIQKDVVFWLRDPLGKIKVSMFCALRAGRIVAKAGHLKKVDASNRIKACHDTLAIILGIGDHRFCVGEVDNVLVQNEEDQCVFIILEPSKTRTLEQIKCMWTQI